MTRPISLDDDTVVEPRSDALLESVAERTSTRGCVNCRSCHPCSKGPGREPTLGIVQAWPAGEAAGTRAAFRHLSPAWRPGAGQHAVKEA